MVALTNFLVPYLKINQRDRTGSSIIIRRFTDNKKKILLRYIMFMSLTQQHWTKLLMFLKNESGTGSAVKAIEKQKENLLKDLKCCPIWPKIHSCQAQVFRSD